MQTQCSEKAYSSTSELCDRYNGAFSPYTLKRSRQTGVLLGNPAPEYIRIGNRILYENETSDAWFERYAKRQTNTAQNEQPARKRKDTNGMAVPAACK